MTKYFKISVLLAIVFILFFSCSSNDEDFEEPITEEPENDPDPTVEITPENVHSYMVDPNATNETAALFYNLYTNAGEKILIGHQDAFYSYYQNNSNQSDVKKTTGSDPALIGLDFMFITDKNYQDEPSNWFYQQEQLILNAAKNAYNKGMAVTFAWHLREPYEENYFYTSEMTEFQRENAFKSILPGGENHNWYKFKLDKLASLFNHLYGNDGKLIPVIFRPFHEFDGNWFWWGAAYCSPSEYQEIWQFTVTYLRDTKNVHNLLYAYSPDQSLYTESAYLERFPGDEFIDILGMDNYYDFSTQSNSGMNMANQKLTMISNIASQKNKIAALTETGYSSENSTPRVSDHFNNLVHGAISNNQPKIAYLCFWSNSTSIYYVPTPTTTYATDFKNFTDRTNVFLVDELTESLYQFP